MQALESEELGSSDGADPDALHTFVWGTTLNLASITSRLRRFLTRYEDPQSHELKYMVLLRQVQNPAQTSFEASTSTTSGLGKGNMVCMGQACMLAAAVPTTIF